MQSERKQRVMKWYDYAYLTRLGPEKETDGLKIGLIDYLDMLTIDRTLSEGISNRTLLDAGCGSGRITVLFALQGNRVVGIDFSKSRIVQAHFTAKANRATNADFLMADIEWLPFRNSTFDSIFSLGTLEYVSQPDVIFSEYWRTSKLGASVLVTAINRVGLLRKVSLLTNSGQTAITLILTSWSPKALVDSLSTKGFRAQVSGYNLTRAVVLIAPQIPIVRSLFSMFKVPIIRFLESIEGSRFGRILCANLIVVGHKELLDGHLTRRQRLDRGREY